MYWLIPAEGQYQEYFAYCEIIRGMYDLPEAGVLANKLKKKRLKEYDYVEIDHSPGLFKHVT